MKDIVNKSDKNNNKLNDIRNMKKCNSITNMNSESKNKSIETSMTVSRSSTFSNLPINQMQKVDQAEMLPTSEQNKDTDE